MMKPESRQKTNAIVHGESLASLRDWCLRPLFVLCCAYYGGIWIWNSLPLDSVLLSRALIGVLLLALATGLLTLHVLNLKKQNIMKDGKTESARRFLLPFFAALAAGLSIAAFFTLFREQKQDALDHMDGQTGTVTGIVLEEKWVASYAGYYIVKVDSIDGQTVDFQLWLETDAPLEEGSGFVGQIVFQKLEDIETGSFAERTYLRSQGVGLQGIGENMRITDQPSGWWMKVLLWGRQMQRHFSKILTQNLGEEQGGFAAALFLGNRDLLPAEIKRDFSRLGISHILALSGMHISIVTTLAGAVGGKIGVRWRRGFSAATAMLYMLIAGFSPSVTRAGIMLLVCIIIQTIGKNSDSFTNLGIAVFAITVMSEGASLDVGLLLSFCAVLAVLLFSRTNQISIWEQPVQKKQCHLRQLIRMPILSATVILFLLPLTCIWFGTVSPLTPIVSVAVSFLTTLLLWLLPLLLLVSPSPLFCGMLSRCAGAVCSVILHLTRTLSDLRGACISLRYPFVPIFAFFIFLLATWTLLTKRGKRKRPACLCLITLAVLSLWIGGWTWANQDHVTAYMLNSGMEEGTLTERNDGITIIADNSAMLIDNSSGSVDILRLGAARAQDAGCTEIESVLLTHIHRKHVQALEKLFAQQKVRSLWLPSDVDMESDIWIGLLQAAQTFGVETFTYSPGETIGFGKASICTYSAQYLSRSTEPIIRIEILAAGERLIYLGAAYPEAVSDLPEVLPKALNDPNTWLWFGGHGPLYKQRLDASGFDVRGIYLSGQAFDYIDPGDRYRQETVLYFGKGNEDS